MIIGSISLYLVAVDASPLDNSDSKGQPFLLTEIEVETYWTSLPDKPETVIELHHAHGSSEQFHSELKSDMEIERLPSGKFLTDAIDSFWRMIAAKLEDKNLSSHKATESQRFHPGTPSSSSGS